MGWTFITAEDIGGRSEQQDRCGVLHRDNVHLAIVADGVGGHGSGSLAAQTVIDVAQRVFAEADLHDPEAFLEGLCQEAHDSVRALEPHANGRSCSTCVFLLLNDKEAHWANVGDSRLYLIRDGRPLQQSRDHSVVALRREQGVPNEPPVGPNVLYMSLGGNGEIVPEISACSIRPRDQFLLCSDGFWGPLELEPVADSLRSGRADAQLAQQWVQRAYQAGGTEADNISLVVALHVQPEGQVASLLRRWRERLSRWF